jgi:hypothetical protein
MRQRQVTREVKCEPNLQYVTAFAAVAQVMRVLGEALSEGRKFTVRIEGKDVEDQPVLATDGKLYATGHLDGSCKITIKMEPPAVCSKCGKDHR